MDMRHLVSCKALNEDKLLEGINNLENDIKYYEDRDRKSIIRSQAYVWDF